MRATCALIGYVRYTILSMTMVSMASSSIFLPVAWTV
jgi:hypothetical protein